MITITAVVCLVGLVVYVGFTEKTRNQLWEDIGRLAFFAALLAWMFALANKILV